MPEEKKKNLFEEISKIRLLGDDHYKKGDYKTAEQFFLQALNLFEETSNSLEKRYVLRRLGQVYYYTSKLNKALNYFHQALELFEQSSDPLEKRFVLRNIGNVYYRKKEMDNALKYFQQALELFEQSSDPLEKRYTLRNIGRVYYEKKKVDKALDYYHKALDLFEQSQDLNKKYVLQNIGNTYYLKSERDKALDYYQQALELFEQDPNPYEIEPVFKDIHQIDPNQAFHLALNSPLGLFWIYLLYQRRKDSGLPIEGKHWYIFWKAAVNWWNDIKERLQSNTLDSSKYRQNWKLKQILDSIDQNITSENLLNFFIGANDLSTDVDSDYYNLLDEQRMILPMWFIELPLHLIHGEKYLKIRLNNLINIQNEYVSYPSVTGKILPPIARVKFQLETQWHQKMDIDHIFYPNTQEEQNQYEKNPERTWLSDIVAMDLDEHLKKEKNLYLTYNCQIFFNAQNPNPDIITTTQKIVIPVVRTRNFQRLERLVLKHNNLLAFLLVVWTIFLSILSNLDELNRIIIFLSGLIENLIVVGVLLVVIFGFLSVGALIWLIKGINKEKKQETVQKFREIV
ncbi:MAG: tetratricopeptide repeat protein [Candidatus Hermodarchaeota archaeon]